MNSRRFMPVPTSQQVLPIKLARWQGPEAIIRATDFHFGSKAEVIELGVHVRLHLQSGLVSLPAYPFVATGDLSQSLQALVDFLAQQAEVDGLR
jgi:hypothetical protein